MTHLTTKWKIILGNHLSMELGHFTIVKALRTYTCALIKVSSYLKSPKSSLHLGARYSRKLIIFPTTRMKRKLLSVYEASLVNLRT